MATDKPNLPRALKLVRAARELLVLAQEEFDKDTTHIWLSSIYPQTLREALRQLRDFEWFAVRESEIAQDKEHEACP